AARRLPGVRLGHRILPAWAARGSRLPASQIPAALVYGRNHDSRMMTNDRPGLSVAAAMAEAAADLVGPVAHQLADLRHHRPGQLADRAGDADGADQFAEVVEDRRGNAAHLGLVLALVDGVALGADLRQLALQRGAVGDGVGRQPLELGAPQRVANL